MVSAAHNSQDRIISPPPSGASDVDMPNAWWPATLPENSKVPSSTPASDTAASRRRACGASAASAMPWPKTNSAAECRLARVDGSALWAA